MNRDPEVWDPETEHEQPPAHWVIGAKLFAGVCLWAAGVMAITALLAAAVERWAGG